MKTTYRTLFACCAAGALAVSLSACGPDDAGGAMSQMALADGLAPGWSMMDLAGVDPAFYGDDADLPEALPMQASYAGDYGYAPAYDYAPGSDDAYYQPLDDSAYYDDGYYDDGYYEDGYYQGGYGDAGYADGGYAADGLLGSGGSDYGLLALAVSLAGMLGDAPPDYGFAYGDVSPWAWQTSDRYDRYAEPIDGGYRYYYYEPDAHRPFFVSDPYYSYGYRDDRLVAIYDREGRRVDARRADLQLRAAKSYYARAEQLHRAADRDRHGVAAPLWARHRAAIAHDRDRWVEAQAHVPAWRQWDARNGERLKRQWADEALVRRGAERSFAKWQKTDYAAPPPAFYTPQVRAERVKQLAELRRERPHAVAERRRDIAKEQREARQAAQRLQAKAQREVPALHHGERVTAKADPRPIRERGAKGDIGPKSAPARLAERRAERLEQRTERLEQRAARTPAPRRATPERALRHADAKPQPEKAERPRAAERPKVVRDRRAARPERQQVQREPARSQTPEPAAQVARDARQDQIRQAADERRAQRAEARQAAEAARAARQQSRAAAPRQEQARVDRPAVRAERGQEQARPDRPQAAGRPARQEQQQARERARQERADARAERRAARRGAPGEG